MASKKKQDKELKEDIARRDELFEKMNPISKKILEEEINKLTPEQMIRMKEKKSKLSKDEIERMRKKFAKMSPEEMTAYSKKIEKQKAMQAKMEKETHGNKKAQKKMMANNRKKAKNFNVTLKRLLKYLIAHKAKLFLVVIATLLATLFNVLSPLVLKQIINSLSTKITDGTEINFTRVGWALTMLGGLYVLNALFTYLQSFWMTDVSQKVLYKLRGDVQNKLMRLPFNYFDTNPKGDILSRTTNDIDNVGYSLTQIVTQLISAVVTIIGVVICMLIISPLLTLICILAIPFIIIITKLITKKSQGYFKAKWKATGELNSIVEETFSGITVIKAFGYEDSVMADFAEANNDFKDISFKAQRISGMLNPSSTLVNNILYVFICIFAGFSVIAGNMNFGDIIAFIDYQKKFTSPITSITSLLNSLQSSIASAERVFELLDEKEEEETSDKYQKLENVKGDIAFSNLKFGYVADKLLMDGLDVNVKAGQMVAIVGPTGAGKTTLVNLLMRFYEINGGKITIDGVSTRDLTRYDLRSIFGMVLQDTWLFNGSIKDNIAYGVDSATDEKIREVAREAQLDFFVKTLADGYDTVINEAGSNISLGQKQLLTIARTMIADPNILILDEATSNVDTRTEVLIQAAMEKLIEGRTSFVIAHRLSTIRNADQILVMKAGNIVEQGNHNSLIEQNGLYAQLYNSQFANS